MLVFRQMVMFVLLMLVGAGTRKKKILTDENQPQITQLVLMSCRLSRAGAARRNRSG